MGVIIRQTLKTTTVYYLATLFGLANRLFLLPNFLSPSQIGFVDNFLYIAIILATISSLGTQSILSKFHAYFKKRNKYEAIAGVVIFFSLIGFTIFSSLYLLLKNQIISLYNNSLLLSYHYNLIIGLALIILFKGIFQTNSIINKRLTVPTILNEGSTKVTTFFLLILIGLNFINFREYIYIYVFSYLTSLILLIMYNYKVLDFNFSFKLKSITNSEYVMSSKYSAFAFFSSFSAVAIQFTDTIMLSLIQNLETAGIYSIAFFIGTSIEMPKRAITSISLPIIAKHFEENKLHEIDKLYKQSSINQGLIGCLFFLLIAINLNSIFNILPNTDTYIVGINVTLIIGLAKLIDMILGVNSEILRTSKYYYIDFYVLFFFILTTIILNYILIPLYQINGAAIASFISIALYNLTRYIILLKLFNFSPFSRSTLKLIALFILMICINYILPEITTKDKLTLLIIVIAKSSIFTLLFLFSCLQLRISKEFNDVSKKAINKFIKNKK